MLKEGTITDEDTKNIIEDIADDPDKAKELLEILGIKSVDDQGHEHTDFIDGAPISSSILQKLPKSKDVTYESLLAALDKTSLTFQRKDLMAKHCLIDKGKAVLLKDPESPQTTECLFCCALRKIRNLLQVEVNRAFQCVSKDYSSTVNE